MIRQGSVTYRPVKSLLLYDVKVSEDRFIPLVWGSFQNHITLSNVLVDVKRYLPTGWGKEMHA